MLDQHDIPERVQVVIVHIVHKIQRDSKLCDEALLCLAAIQTEQNCDGGKSTSTPDTAVTISRCKVQQLTECVGYPAL